MCVYSIAQNKNVSRLFTHKNFRTPTEIPKNHHKQTQTHFYMKIINCKNSAFKEGLERYNTYRTQRALFGKF